MSSTLLWNLVLWLFEEKEKYLLQQLIEAPQTKNLRDNPAKRGGNIIGFFQPSNLSKELQNKIIVPNWSKNGENVSCTVQIQNKYSYTYSLIFG